MSGGITKIKVKLDKNAKREDFGTYPKSIQELFRDSYFSYIIAIRVKGQERYSRYLGQFVREWLKVEAYAYDTDRKREKVFLVEPGSEIGCFKRFEDALQAFIGKVKRISFYFDKGNIETYRGALMIENFFKSPDSNGIRYTDVYYSDQYKGYVAYAYNEGGKYVDSVRHRKADESFASPWDAVRALLQQFNRGRPRER